MEIQSCLPSQGNQVREQDWEVALFQNLATAPATLEASHIAECYALFPDHAIEGRDVAQFCRRPHLHHRRTTRQARIANAVHAVRRLGDAVLLAEVRRLHHQLLHRAVKSTGYHSRGLDKLGR